MAGVKLNKRYLADLMSELPADRLARILGKIALRTEQGLDGLENSSPRSQIGGALDAAKVVDLVVGVGGKVLDKKIAQVKLAEALMGRRNRGGEADSAPRVIIQEADLDSDTQEAAAEPPADKGTPQG